MKKKALFLILIMSIFLLAVIVWGFLIFDTNSFLTSYKQIQSEDFIDKNLQEVLISDYFNSFIKYMMLCILDGIIICFCIVMFIIVIKNDINFINATFKDKKAANKIKREELRMQQANERKAARISALEKELNELKKDGD